ncbi:hypothetical protein GEMRC1_003901 [Eukaryota sp. GEM-RC1]
MQKNLTNYPARQLLCQLHEEHEWTVSEIIYDRLKFTRYQSVWRLFTFDQQLLQSTICSCLRSLSSCSLDDIAHRIAKVLLFPLVNDQLDGRGSYLIDLPRCLKEINSSGELNAIDHRMVQHVLNEWMNFIKVDVEILELYDAEVQLGPLLMSMMDKCCKLE